MRFSLFLAFFLAIGLVCQVHADTAATEPASFLSNEEVEKLAGKSEKFEFQAEVNRMMKLIIHSLYKTKVRK
jgi:hypothetical protein